MKFNLTKKELKDLNGSKLKITLNFVEFLENNDSVVFVVNFLKIFSAVSLAGYTISSLANFQNRQFLVSEIIL